MTVPNDVQFKSTFKIDNYEIPRIFTGLWQLSSPAWGTAPKPKMRRHFKKLIENGYTAFDMADHYGDSEIIFSELRSQVETPTFCATKWCIFADDAQINEDIVAKEMNTRISRTGGVQLIQFYFHNIARQEVVLEACRLLQEDGRAKIGLCNFSTEAMIKVVESGVKVYTNQVQFSLIDSRPRYLMADKCLIHDIKLLTYGTLCGGFLSDKWLGKDEPELFNDSITPSQRKYFDIIVNWGGWELFQELLKVLNEIAVSKGSGVNISIVAARWVLDHSYVGAVIVGTRLGISEHIDDNKIILDENWEITTKERESINVILSKSNADQMINYIGDCGAEYN